MYSILENKANWLAMCFLAQLSFLSAQDRQLESHRIASQQGGRFDGHVGFLGKADMEE